MLRTNSISKQKKESLLSFSFLIKNNTGKYEKVCPLETPVTPYSTKNLHKATSSLHNPEETKKSLDRRYGFFLFLPSPTFLYKITYWNFRDTKKRQINNRFNLK